MSSANPLFVAGLIPLVLVHVVAVLAPPILALLRREAVDISAWWALPFELVLGEGALGILVWSLSSQGNEETMGVGVGGSLVLLAMAGLFGVSALGLALVRAVTPGGPTQRRWGSTAVVVGAATVAGTLASVRFAQTGADLWGMPIATAWALLLWAVLLDRRGPDRLEVGRRQVASWILSGAVLLIVMPAPFVVAQWCVQGSWPHGGFHRVGPSILVLFQLSVLRIVVGPPRWDWIAPFAVVVGSMAVTAMSWGLYRGVPWGVQLPLAVDAATGEPLGDMGKPALPACTMRGDGSRWGCERPTQPVERVTLDHDFPMDGIHPDVFSSPGERQVLLNRGREHITVRRPQPSHRGVGMHVRPRGPGRVDLEERRPDGTVERLATDIPIAELPPSTWPVTVQADPTWTAQDWVTVCVTMGAQRDCTIAR